MDEYIGVIKLFAGDFAPTGWMFCNGKELQIQRYMPLYMVIGSKYGGDGLMNFRLPNLVSRVPIGAYMNNENPDVSLSRYELASKEGNEKVSLELNNMPPIKIKIPCSTTRGGGSSPINCVMGVDSSVSSNIYSKYENDIDAAVFTVADVATATAAVSGATAQSVSTATLASATTAIAVGTPAVVIAVTAVKDAVLVAENLLGATAETVRAAAIQAASVQAEIAEANGEFMKPFSLPINKGSVPHAPISIVQPVLALNYIICFEGIYPGRD